MGVSLTQSFPKKYMLSLRDNQHTYRMSYFETVNRIYVYNGNVPHTDISDVKPITVYTYIYIYRD